MNKYALSMIALLVAVVSNTGRAEDGSSTAPVCKRWIVQIKETPGATDADVFNIISSVHTYTTNVSILGAGSTYLQLLVGMTPGSETDSNSLAIAAGGISAVSALPGVHVQCDSLASPTPRVSGSN